MATSKRADNFTTDEIDKLIKEAVSRKRILNATFSITKNVKNAAWEEIAQAVRRVQGKDRSDDNVRKKLSALKCEGGKANGSLCGSSGMSLM